MTSPIASHAKASWMSRLPYMGGLCASFFQENRAAGAPYFQAMPFLIAMAAAFLTLSGAVLAVYYNPWHAFDSVQFIDRNVNNGWLVRTYHATGTTMIFGVTYIYLFRSLLRRAYRAPGEFVWMLGVTLLAVLLLTGWLGYVLTGGAAGHWSLVNAANAALTMGGFPGAVGMWFFGGPDGADTLMRMEVFHVLLALALLLVVWLMLGSRRAAAAPPAPGKGVAFYPYYLAQYFAALAIFALVFAGLAFYAPQLGTSQLNQIPAAPLAMPVGAGVPWYLGPAAGLIGVFPSRGLSIVAVIAAIAVLAALPWLDRSGPAGRRGKVYGFLTWVLALDVIGLGFAANSADTGAATILASVFTAWYFFHFLVLTPVVTAMEAE